LIGERCLHNQIGVASAGKRHRASKLESVSLLKKNSSGCNLYNQRIYLQL